MKPEILAETQVRLLLERRCSEIGRRLLGSWGSGNDFLLVLFDFGEGGFAAHFSTGSPREARDAVARWLAAGGRVEVPAPLPHDLKLSLAERCRQNADQIAAQLPAGIGFAALVWQGDTNLAYVSTAMRPDMITFFCEWLDKSAVAARGGAS